MNWRDVERQRSSKRAVEPNPWAHSFSARSRRRVNSNFKPGEVLMLKAMRTNTRLRALSPDEVRREGKAAGAAPRLVQSYLDSRVDRWAA